MVSLARRMAACNTRKILPRNIRIFIRWILRRRIIAELAEELKSVVMFWIAQGIRIFRVDNPHTKPFAFWEWMIGEVQRKYPDVIFLAEAFTRPKVMYRLAKLGFTQSYTYFRVEKYQGGIDGIFHGDYAAAGERFFPA